MPYYCTFWSYDAGPPFDEIEDRVNALISRGATRVHFAAPRGLGSDYCLVISDTAFTDEDADTKWCAWFRALPDDDAYCWWDWSEPEADGKGL